MIPWTWTLAWCWGTFPGWRWEPGRWRTGTGTKTCPGHKRQDMDRHWNMFRDKFIKGRGKFRRDRDRQWNMFRDKFIKGRGKLRRDRDRQWNMSRDKFTKGRDKFRRDRERQFWILPRDRSSEDGDIHWTCPSSSWPGIIEVSDFPVPDVTYQTLAGRE